MSPSALQIRDTGNGQGLTLAHQWQHFLPPLQHPTSRECFGFVVVWNTPLHTPDFLSVGVGGVEHCAVYPLTLVVALELAREPDIWCCTTQIRVSGINPPQVCGWTVSAQLGDAFCSNTIGNLGLGDYFVLNAAGQHDHARRVDILG